MATERYDPSVAGIVFDVQRFSVHDGPGIRTVVFLKGCSLRCLWCSNPESMTPRIQLGVDADRCLGIDKCGECLKVAPDPGAFVIGDRRVTALRATDAENYLPCAAVCPVDALKAWGKKRTVGEILREVVADRRYYEESGGGLTLSGGEALLQTGFAVELLKAARAEGIGTCVETALNYRPEVLDQVLPYVDLALCDLKHLDPQEHRRFTGVANERILANLAKVVGSGTPTVIRIPVVPGYNGTEENLRATARFLAEDLSGQVVQVQLLPFRKLGEKKYASLGMPYPMANLQAPPREVWERDIRRFAEIMSSYGLDAVAGSAGRIASVPSRSAKCETHGTAGESSAPEETDAPADQPFFE